MVCGWRQWGERRAAHANTHTHTHTQPVEDYTRPSCRARRRVRCRSTHPPIAAEISAERVGSGGVVKALGEDGASSPDRCGRPTAAAEGPQGDEAGAEPQHYGRLVESFDRFRTRSRFLCTEVQ